MRFGRYHKAADELQVRHTSFDRFLQMLHRDKASKSSANVGAPEKATAVQSKLSSSIKGLFGEVGRMLSPSLVNPKIHVSNMSRNFHLNAPTEQDLATYLPVNKESIAHKQKLEEEIQSAASAVKNRLPRRSIVFT